MSGWTETKIPKIERPFCGAKCRDGHSCRRRALQDKTRCRIHGGLSTGPKTPEGKARIVAARRRRAEIQRQAAAYL